MPKKLSFDYVKNFINQENELLSTTYINNKALLLIKCKKCDNIFNQNFSSYHIGHRCQKCANVLNGIKSSKKRYGHNVPLKNIIRICEFCKKEYTPKRSNQKFCNKICSITHLCNDKEKLKINGRKGFYKRQTHNRSKNEILFAKLCINYFGINDILCNEQIFKDNNGNFWDCDIYIKSLKTAILWDGWYWHYRPNVSNKQKSRDILKRKIIIDNGDKYYTIIDKGKYNREFVQEQFNLFIHKILFKQVLEMITRIII
jgi:hypothetical protein